MTVKILSLLEAAGLTPRRESSTEHSAPCPVCGGKDRFRVFTAENRWFCRGCNKAGDAIEYFRHVRGMSFPDACRAAGETERIQEWAPRTPRPSRQTWKPKQSAKPDKSWERQAGTLVLSAHDRLLK